MFTLAKDYDLAVIRAQSLQEAKGGRVFIYQDEERNRWQVLAEGSVPMSNVWRHFATVGADGAITKVSES